MIGFGYVVPFIPVAGPRSSLRQSPKQDGNAGLGFRDQTSGSWGSVGDGRNYEKRQGLGYGLEL